MARSYSSWITGLKYRSPDGTNRAKACANLRGGEVLSLVPEPDNPFSQNSLAVAIKYRDRHLGYVPERHAWIGRVLEEGKRLTCVVDRVETGGLLFRRARFVGLLVSVEDVSRPLPEKAEKLKKPPKPKKDLKAEAVRKHLEARAREACIDGLRVLAHIALSDDDLSTAELAEEANYIEARLVAQDIPADAETIEGLLATAQSLAVPQRSFVRALNVVATDKAHFTLLIASLVKLVANRILNDRERAAVIKVLSAGKAKGWIE